MKCVFAEKQLHSFLRSCVINAINDSIDHSVHDHIVLREYLLLDSMIIPIV